MKKIGIIISSFYPKIGGSEKQLQLISENLIEKGYEVEVVTRRYKGLARIEYVGNIKVRRIGIVKLNKSAEKISFYVNSILYYLINFKSKPDIIIASQTGVAARVAIFIKRIFNCKVLVRIAGGELKKFETNKSKFSMKFKNVDKFIVLSEDMKKTMERLNEKRVEKITNAVVKQVDIVSNTGRYVLFCGRIEKVKGLDLLLESWRQMQKAGFEIPLVIVGDGSLKKDLEDEYSDLRSVKWVGEDKNTSKYYKNARLLINTSEYEGISNTILEAQSYGIPVVASNVGGNKDLISNYKNGILFERDSSDVIKTICEIYFNEKKILDMKSNSLEYIKNHYIENIIGKYIKQFN
ncbi:GDP-mannose-dependent alpha-mannosyltransferase [uncultured Clostridium sp.]|uniref:glycosyltransferase family 4 protein n=1 Tax=uncultured Clostridium sp. TaxID=59620 RepID=UPI000822B672|nr:glycosyltransferase family 4 protein [uncultured Clostridium sp.]SCJ98228.1 GDP-mannose-dependent alpha-mannosyltransferase [uncultured Clostridium sp.]